MPAPPSSRLISLDQFRGYTVAGMLLVNFVGNLAACPAVLTHFHTYVTYADTIMAQFLFAAGFAFRLVWRRQAERGGTPAALRRAARRLLGLLLLSLVWYGAGAAPPTWHALVEGGAAAALYESFKRHWFVTLTHIAVTSLWILPVVPAGPRVRVAWLVGSAAAHVGLSAWFNFHWIYAEPQSIDGGPLGFLSWSVPALVGTLACDAVAGRPPGEVNVRRLFGWSMGLMLLGYLLSCGTRWYDVDPAATAGPPAPLAERPVWPDFSRIHKERLADWLAEPPFVPPPDAAHRQLNYWMMGQRPLPISYSTFAAGWSLAIYALCIGLCDRRGWALGLFRTLGTNALAAYLLHEVVKQAVERFVPADSPWWYGWSMFGVYFALVYLFVRHLEKHGIYLRL